MLTLCFIDPHHMLSIPSNVLTAWCATTGCYNSVVLPAPDDLCSKQQNLQKLSAFVQILPVVTDLRLASGLVTTVGGD